ncbi:nucleotidyl transferase AbiEii/AbiGii toxin family protein [Kitasatospora cheerisanensis]|uniref:Ankyrin n=1 Tax=Kitasatospora cheerisanensis KCTC 2395 TaxID=1348663 RepID=A0A066YPU8_9ACTN|nr:nucleotidyl transferase AbiEii/AbiGii toxin family protein [Kitasatospora cheerisanensis]KDN83573.1 hypothetical protein KCH_50550 [Kitasatospora cheerisanensis KCTC 2395]
MPDHRLLPSDRRDLPSTFRTVDDPRATQPKVFDPALKQFDNAYRAGEPRFADPALSAAWYAARRAAMDAVLTAVAASGWAGHLVLRGSVVLKSWFGDAAREPGDLDFVVTPADLSLDDPRTADLFHGVARAVAASSGPVRFLAELTATEDIWTYERAPAAACSSPGRRPACPAARCSSTSSSTSNCPSPRSRWRSSPARC